MNCDRNYFIISDWLEIFSYLVALIIGGHIIIYSGEVRHNWLNTIRCIPDADKRLDKIPLVEKALSQFLKDIRIVRTKHQKSVTVDDYRIRLRKLITNLGDYLAKKKLPAIWPDSLADLQMCVVTESCPLMVTPEGQILVPASCPGFLLIEFLSKNMEGNSSLNKTTLGTIFDIKNII